MADDATNDSGSKDSGLPGAKSQSAQFAHDLRAPLSVILLWTKMLRGEQNIDPALLREGLEAIQRSAEELQKLLDNTPDR